MKFVNILSSGHVILGVLVGALLGSALGYFGQCTSGTCPLTSTWWRGALYGAFLGFLFTFSTARKPGATVSTPDSQAGDSAPELQKPR